MFGFASSAPCTSPLFVFALYHFAVLCLFSPCTTSYSLFPCLLRPQWACVLAKSARAKGMMLSVSERGNSYVSSLSHPTHHLCRGLYVRTVFMNDSLAEFALTQVSNSTFTGSHTRIQPIALYFTHPTHVRPSGSITEKWSQPSIMCWSLEKPSQGNQLLSST